MTSFIDMYGGRRTNGQDRNPNDLYPTPPFVTYALTKLEEYRLPKKLWEPAMGQGYMARELQRCGYDVTTSDIEVYPDLLTKIDGVQDFLAATKQEGFEGVVTNPPYAKNLAEKFVHKALSMYDYCAVLCRTNFVEGKGRYERLFIPKPPSRIYSFSGRFSCNEKVFETEKVLTGMVNYSWFVWDYKNRRTQPGETQFKWVYTDDFYYKWTAERNENCSRRIENRSEPSGDLQGHPTQPICSDLDHLRCSKGP